jgi:hypothetical protein
MVKDKTNTLADRLYQATYDTNHPFLYGAEALRQKLFRARRYVLDDRMSAFLSDLSTAAFLPKNQKIKLHGVLGAENDYLCEIMPRSRHSNALVEQMRLAARLPHPYTWIEYDQTASERRDAELTCVPRANALIPRREGWLLEQHPHSDTAFAAHIVTQFRDQRAVDVGILPWVFCWSTEDQPLPWRAETMLDAEMPTIIDGKRSIIPMSALLCGIEGYRSPQVSGWLHLYTRAPHENPQATARMLSRILNSYGGTVRRIWALLATINDIPILTREIKASKGFMGRGSYRRFLDHRTITLHVPIQKDVRKLARQIVACARRRAHMVRGHWRIDWHHPLNPLCSHTFTVESVCKHCNGHRLWVHQHQRGDASRGFVQTDYRIHHDNNLNRGGAAT